MVRKSPESSSFSFNLLVLRNCYENFSVKTIELAACSFRNLPEFQLNISLQTSVLWNPLLYKNSTLPLWCLHQRGNWTTLNSADCVPEETTQNLSCCKRQSKASCRFDLHLTISVSLLLVPRFSCESNKPPIVNTVRKPMWYWFTICYIR